mmetsp:Transcript_788/g.2288  ORF Transcript_788/g.2288 Transcript_788/m.2288 type:complete len:349 (-) Transcript_788:219-1265(-)
MQHDTKYDEVLLNMAGHCGGIAPLLDTFFSFLYRKTDFFHIMAEGENMGFHDGVAEKLVLRAFRKYEAASAMARQEKSAAGAAADGERLPAAATALSSSPPEPCPATPADPPADAAPLPPPDSASEEAQLAAASGPAPTSARTATVPPRPLARPPEAPYNGGHTARYSWEQTLHDVSLHVPVPAATRARDVVCVITKQRLSARLRGSEEALVDGRFPCDARNGQEVWESVKVDESTWSLGESAGGMCLSVYLEKSRESWWASALHGDAEIDTTKVDSTRSMYEYDGETQGAIRKILFDQDQKRKGQPTSDEMQNEELLRRAWDAEGSPFRGTPYDPSKVSLSPGGSET